jgi:hypothetical protein
LDDRNGELMWPQRFGAKEVEAIKAGLGPYMASGRLQQSPQPKGGGIFKSEWWQVWEGTHFPIIDLVIASLDSAFTEKQENDPSALTVWGTFKHPETGKTRVILIEAWRKHLQMHGSATPRLEDLRVGDARTATVLAPIDQFEEVFTVATLRSALSSCISWRRRSSRHTVFCRLWTHPTHALARDRPNPNP